MYVILECSKFNPPERRVADIGDRDVQEVIKWFDTAAMECPVCGPCSHVEMSFGGYLTVLSEHDDEQDALTALHELDQAKEAAA